MVFIFYTLCLNVTNKILFKPKFHSNKMYQLSILKLLSQNIRFNRRLTKYLPTDEVTVDPFALVFTNNRSVCSVN